MAAVRIVCVPYTLGSAHGFLLLVLTDSGGLVLLATPSSARSHFCGFILVGGSFSATLLLIAVLESGVLFVY